MVSRLMSLAFAFGARRNAPIRSIVVVCELVFCLEDLEASGTYEEVMRVAGQVTAATQSDISLGLSETMKTYCRTEICS